MHSSEVGAVLKLNGLDRFLYRLGSMLRHSGCVYKFRLCIELLNRSLGYAAAFMCLLAYSISLEAFNDSLSGVVDAWQACRGKYKESCRLVDILYPNA